MVKFIQNINHGFYFPARSSLLYHSIILMDFILFPRLAFSITVQQFMFFLITLKLLYSNNYTFQGALQDVRLISGPHGYLNQCPHLDTSCPTCGQFSVLQSTVDTLTRHLQELSQRVCLFTTG